MSSSCWYTVNLNTIMLLLLVLTLSVVATTTAKDGQYQSDNSGRYIPTGDEGRYYPDFSGRYIHDGKGRYFYDGTGKYADKSKLLGLGSFERRRIVPTPKPTPPPPPPKPIIHKRYDKEGKWKVIRHLHDFELKDGYHYEYDTENKISAEETGKLFNVGKSNEAMKAKGSYHYVGPDDVVYEVKYTADENGFIPVGEHIPTPPPIPHDILRALKLTNQL